MSTVAVIGARYKSTKFETEALAEYNGKSFLWWAIHHAVKLNFTGRIAVAASDNTIVKYAEQFPGIEIETMLYSPCATEKIYRYYTNHRFFDYYISWPASEISLSPKEINTLWPTIEEYLKNNPYEIATIYSKFCSREDLETGLSCKVVASHSNHALYFSRNVIPVSEDGHIKELEIYKRHISFFVFTKEYLNKHGSNLWFNWDSFTQEYEGLEQNRFVDYGTPTKLFEIDIRTN